jgi:hypothetical protein
MAHSPGTELTVPGTVQETTVLLKDVYGSIRYLDTSAWVVTKVKRGDCYNILKRCRKFSVIVCCVNFLQNTLAKEMCFRFF